MAATIATPEFLSALKQLYPAGPAYVDSAWYAAAAVAFSASNCPDAVPRVLEYVLSDLEAIAAPHQDRLAAARKIRDALFKSGLISGFPKVINALLSLYEVTPAELRDVKTLRNPTPSTEELTHAGQAFFDLTYGETAASTQASLSAIHPDLEFFTTTFGYGYAYAFMGATSPAETSFVMLSALVPTDAPRQIGWHLRGALRNGATEEQVRAVREIAIRISKAAGVTWRHDIPDL